MRFLISLILILSALTPLRASNPLPKIKDGSYYGVNYTVPFAHAYRALDALGVDHHAAVDRDVYHLARLGLDAFRLHLWDVELADGEGNLLEAGNGHLDVLDYLIAQLEKRGIAVMLTAQTNFGNGYPERNSDPNGAYSYKYEKCDVHDNPAAQQAQETYLRDLVRHVNPYTGMSYAADPSIIALEINNEPCHSGSAEQITAYVDRMVDALRSAGWKKEILYNVSHNLDRVNGFYDADIDGTTYQWYPTGLVHGAQRHGNFLPMLDSYDIPFDTVKGFEGRSRVIYEYDPADVLDTYLYPAAARSFRKAGFTWVTQFAYDPIDMARHNTEYQTHFLNLAYTPGKAVGMMIAAEVMKQLPTGADYGKYPVDTVFGADGRFLVSARRNLAMLNDGERYYHTNATDIAPVNTGSLRAVAGVGSSPLVTTDGTGAYFLDRLDNGLWRLEVMPDIKLTSDPFAKPSLSRSVGETIDRPVRIALDKSFPGLEGDIYFKRVDNGTGIVNCSAGSLELAPGVYILGSSEKKVAHTSADSKFGLRNNMKIGEFVVPARQTDVAPALIHRAPLRIQSGSPLTITAEWVSDTEPDSIVVYPSTASFWNERNKLYSMKKTGKYEYSVTVPAVNGEMAYRIVSFAGGKATTWPSGLEGTPLDWDFAALHPEAVAEYRVKADVAGSPVTLLSAEPDLDGSEYTTIPESWRGVSYTYHRPFAEAPSLILDIDENAAADLAVITKYVEPLVRAYAYGDASVDYDTLRVRIAADSHASAPETVKIGLVNFDGFTYTAPLPLGASEIDLPLASFTLDSTILSPAPYPAFIKRTFEPDPSTATPLVPSEIQTLTIQGGKGTSLGILGVELR